MTNAIGTGNTRGRVTVMMIPMLRRLLNVLAVVSGVLLVLVVALWVRSLFRYDGVQVVVGGDVIQISCVSGAVTIGWANDLARAGAVSQFRSFPTPEWDDEWEVSFAGFGFETGQYWVEVHGVTTQFKSHYLSLPHWSLALLVTVIPLAVLARHVRNHRRHAVACCVTCGYDLRATPERCPECGTAPG